MTTTATPARPAPTKQQPPTHRKRAVIVAAAVVAIVAAVAIAVWAVTNGSSTHQSRPVSTTSAAVAPAAQPQPGDAYAGFCQNNSDLCATGAPTQSAAPNAYSQFCQNNSDLCTVGQRRAD
jgi:hypothetical protein